MYRIGLTVISMGCIAFSASQIDGMWLFQGLLFMGGAIFACACCMEDSK